MQRSESSAVHAVCEQLRAQRLDPLLPALRSTTDGLPAARRLIILPSTATTAVPLEALLHESDPWTISYAPSGTVLTYLRKLPRTATQGGLLALGDPVFDQVPPSADPGPLPDHGLLLAVVVPGGNAAQHGLKRGDVLLSYNSVVLRAREDLKVSSGPGQSIPVDVWRDGDVSRHELSPGKLGVAFDRRPADVAIKDQRRLNQILTTARSGSEHFDRLPGTRFEVEALARLFESAHQPVRLLTDTAASEPALDRLAADGASGEVFVHPSSDAWLDRRSLSSTFRGDPHPDGLARPARASLEQASGLRRTARDA